MSKLVDCPHCGHDESDVYLSKRSKEGGYRRHKCMNPECGKRFTSLQVVVSKGPYKKRARTEPA